MDNKEFWPREKQKKEVLDAFSVIEPDTLLFKRIPSPTPYQVIQNLKIARDLVTKNSCDYYINDTRKSNLPTAKVRDTIREWMPYLNGHINFLIIIINEGFQFEISLQFILQTLELDYEVSIVKSFEEAMEIINNDRKHIDAY